MQTNETPVGRSCPAEIIKARVAVMKAIEGVGKTGHNSFHKYDYASDFDVLNAVRGPMVENGLALEMWPVSIETDDDKNMRVLFMMQWQHESGVVSEPMPWYGVANDRDKSGKNGDKWFNKAATAAEKYFLLKQLHIPASKDMDPDNDAGQDTQPEAKTATPKATPDAEAKVNQWVDAQIAFLAAIKTADEYDKWRESPKVEQNMPVLQDTYPDNHKRLIAASMEAATRVAKPLAAE